MKEVVFETIMKQQNFKTQTHALMKSTQISKNEAISMIIQNLEPRIKQYSSTEILNKLSNRDTVLLYKITYSRKDAERNFFKEKNHSNRLVHRMRDLTDTVYELEDSSDRFNRNDLVLKHLNEIFTEKTALFVRSVLEHGEAETKAIFGLTDRQFYDKIRKMTTKYIPNHRGEINAILDYQSKSEIHKQNVIKELVNAHYVSEQAVQSVILAHRDICENLIGECNTPYISKQTTMLNSYIDAPQSDKQALVRYLIKIEKS